MDGIGTTPMVMTVTMTVLLVAMSCPGDLPGKKPPPAQTRPDTHPAKPALTKISEHLWVYAGPINVGILRDGEKALLIDCGDGAVAGRLGELGVKSVDWVLFTHHHRDQACGATAFTAAGARIGVPEAERRFFAAPQSAFEGRYGGGTLSYPNGPCFALAEAIHVDAGYADGQTIAWGPATIRAIATPGHTASSMSYEVHVDAKRIVFSGDLIYDEGQVWDLYSLDREYGPCGPVVTDRKGNSIKYPILGWSDYEAFLGARLALEKSLEKIAEAKPDLVVPAHGRIMREPAGATKALAKRLDRCFDNYIAVSHLRWDFAAYYSACLDPARMDFLPLWKDGKDIRTKKTPACLSHRGATSWVLKSRDGAALVADYEKGVEKELQAMVEKGEISGVECLWISHYHDDHCRAGLAPFRKAFPSCIVIADSHVADVIREPSAWPPLPCLNPEPVKVDRVTTEGQSWAWHEFQLAAHHFPGQTLYHGGLLAEAGDLRLLFVGDSLTAGGLEDYCAYNRNGLGPGVGYDRCLELVEKIKPTDLLYAHRGQSFAYTAEDCRFMRANLAERVKLFGEIMPWDDPNYGTDGWWVMCRPWEQRVKAGSELAFDVVIMNYSSAARTAACRAVPPRAWGGPTLPPASTADTSGWAKAEIRPKTEGRVRVSLAVPQGAKPGKCIVPVDLCYGTRTLPQFTVATVVVEPD